jgi:hypothetical protein
MPVSTDTKTRYRQRGAPIIHDTIDNETIAINQLSGTYYSLEGAAAVAWDALRDGASVSHIARRLESTYDAQGEPLEQPVAAFIGELLAEELIVEGAPDSDGAAEANGPGHEQGNGRTTATDGALPPFTGLRLQRYNDLEVMLLADPIHEVDDTGWPMPLADSRE